MVYLENAPRYELLESEYAWEKTFAEESRLRKARHPLLHRIGRIPKTLAQKVTKRNKLLALVARYFAPGPLLDIGCAGGHTLASLPLEYTPNGIEISPLLCHVASLAFEPRGGKVIQADALSGLQQLQGAEFTGVIMTSFLEHDTNAKSTLLAARNTLRRDGAVIIKVPNYASWNRIVSGKDWCGFRFPDHVNYFTPNTLIKLVQETGYGIARFDFGDHLPTSDTMWMVARRA